MFRKRLDLVITVCILYAIVFIYGCAAVVPFNECGGDTACEDRSIRYEDYKIKRLQVEAERRACIMPRLWDDRSRQCKTGDTMIW